MACRSPKSCRAERLGRALAAAALLACSLGAPAGLVAQEEKIPFKRESGAVDSSLLLRTALALGLVVALGIGGVYALKRLLPGTLGGAAGAPGRIKVLEVRRVTPKLTLLLVEIDGRTIALAQSGERVCPLPLDAP